MASEHFDAATREMGHHDWWELDAPFHQLQGARLQFAGDKWGDVQLLRDASAQQRAP